MRANLRFNQNRLIVNRYKMAHHARVLESGPSHVSRSTSLQHLREARLPLLRVDLAARRIVSQIHPRPIRFVAGRRRRAQPRRCRRETGLVQACESAPRADFFGFVRAFALKTNCQALQTPSLIEWRACGTYVKKYPSIFSGYLHI
ncbi:hypothetical protein BURKHO8Y_110094 [Burkholderia sp. 8Y]|nr:hypothetical protein BURKHO8Y_110094 [Burkholderia sp. 8Y]